MSRGAALREVGDAGLEPLTLPREVVWPRAGMQLCVVSVELEQHTVPTDNISDIFSVRSKAKWPENRFLWYRYVNWKRTCYLVSLSMHKSLGLITDV